MQKFQRRARRLGFKGQVCSIVIKLTNQNPLSLSDVEKSLDKLKCCKAVSVHPPARNNHCPVREVGRDTVFQLLNALNLKTNYGKTHEAFLVASVPMPLGANGCDKLE